MRRAVVGKRRCCQQEVTYSLLIEERENGTEDYGIEVRMGEDCVQIASVTPIQCRILSLVDRMVQGGVTPVTARDVVLDWLVEQEPGGRLIVCETP